MSETIAWHEGQWRNPPVRTATTSLGALVAEAAEGSDAWRTTSYGFVHDTEHALLRPFAPGMAIEVDYLPRMSQQFDQAGLIVRFDDEHWIKAGTEFADGLPRIGAVVTDGLSDWSSAPVPGWNERPIRIRASWADDALTVRAGLVGEPLQFIRLAPWPAIADRAVSAGPYLCAPTRSGFETEFLAWRVTPADDSLH
ncbi:DUF1349 domain-containing protein [Microbacterium tumbae]